MTVFDPGEGRTNIVGHLQLAANNGRGGHLRIASGVTYVGAAVKDVDTKAMVYVKGNDTAYTNVYGNLELSGGTIYTSQSRYIQVFKYGQVTVTNNSKIIAYNCTWLHGGGSTPARLTVGSGGAVYVDQIHISRSTSGIGTEIHLEEGGTISPNALTLASDISNPVGTFRFNGGALQARTERADFFGTPTGAKWEGIKVLVGEKGAVFNTSNTKVLYMGRPLMSDAEHDGGICKAGGSYVVLLTTNCYNGATVVKYGGIQLRADNALPPGTTLRLSDNTSAYIDANTYDSASPARDTTQWIGRVEGAGEIRNCSQVHVTNAIAPSATGTITFKQTCDLRGDFKIFADASRCGILEVQGSNQSISGLTLKSADLSQLNRNFGAKYRIFKATNGYTGTFNLAADWSPRWKVQYAADGAYIRPVKGFTVDFK